VRRFLPLAEHPFELLFALLALFNGAAIAAGVAPPASFNATLPPPVVIAWGLTQALAGACITAGIIIRYSQPALLAIGFRLERAGLWPLSAVAAAYSAVALMYAGLPAAFPVGVLAAVAIACAARARRIAALEKTIRKHAPGAGSGE
jgi:hypothetical protein